MGLDILNSYHIVGNFGLVQFSYISYDVSPYENKIYEKFYIQNFNHVKYTCTCQTSGRGIPACAHTKIRIQKFILKALWPFIRKFAPSKISSYTIYVVLVQCGSGDLKQLYIILYVVLVQCGSGDLKQL